MTGTTGSRTRGPGRGDCPEGTTTGCKAGKREADRPSWMLFVGAYGVVVMFLMVLASPGTAVYDESAHLEGARFLATGGSLPAFLSNPFPSVPGPLYAVIHALGSPLTEFEAVRVRVLNFALLVGALGFTGMTLSRMGYERPGTRVAPILAMPTLWVCGGMALTEVPALMSASAACYFVSTALASRNPGRREWTCLVSSGLLAGLAVLGRQTYLPALAGYLAIGAGRREFRGGALVALGVSVMVVAPVFWVWQGLVPPANRFAGGGISGGHLLLSIGYFGFAMLLMAPRYFVAGARWAVTATVLAALGNWLYFHVEVTLLSRLARDMPAAIQHRYPLLCGCALVGVVAATIIATAGNVWRWREDRGFLLVMGLTGMQVATAAGIVHIYSSRYILAAFPFALFVAQRFVKADRWALVQLVGGMAVGCASLGSFYWREP